LIIFLNSSLTVDYENDPSSVRLNTGTVERLISSCGQAGCSAKWEMKYSAIK